MKIWNQWVSFGEIPQWWGPGHDGSLIRTDAARPVTGFLIQRADQSPLKPLGYHGLAHGNISLQQAKLSSTPHNPIPSSLVYV